MDSKTDFSRRSTGVLQLLSSLLQTRLGKTQKIHPSSKWSPGCREILPRKSISPSRPLSGRAKPWGCKKVQNRGQIPTFPHRALPTFPHIFGTRARVQCHRIGIIHSERRSFHEKQKEPHHGPLPSRKTVRLFRCTGRGKRNA